MSAVEVKLSECRQNSPPTLLPRRSRVAKHPAVWKYQREEMVGFFGCVGFSWGAGWEG